MQISENSKKRVDYDLQCIKIGDYLQFVGIAIFIYTIIPFLFDVVLICCPWNSEMKYLICFWVSGEVSVL